MQDKKTPSRAMKGNRNNLKHGAFAQLTLKSIDGRTREGKTLTAAQSALVSAVGETQRLFHFGQRPETPARTVPGFHLSAARLVKKC